ncbi:MAG TPA: 2-amino-4-hydroxy-6-hydroxymethyldihydropteridine diphosphokinase [Acidimicrobiia bacterium]|nr:2-amino-4-hydroxy-6-hydroxymethyldihydropteridine diphosphokinase [Acidimicrobiia bacterium]
MTRAYLALGSNLGDRAAHLQDAVTALAALTEHERVEVVAVSAVYETEPVGGPEQGPYLNAVVALETDRSPHDLLAIAQQLETRAGRVREERWGPRTLDVDVLLVGDERVDTDDLVVPHPRLWERAFVLAPLADVAPDLVTAPPGGWSGVERTALALRIPGRHPTTVEDAPGGPGDARRA